MDEFTTRIEELNSKLTIKKNVSSQQNIALHAESCDGSAPTAYFINSLGNGSLTGSMMHSSSSSSQLAKESPYMLEISVIAKGQRQILHQLDNLSSLLRETYGRAPKARTNRTTVKFDAEKIKAPLVLSLVVGGLGIILLKGLLTRN
ncbi:hypothetical protein CRG98_017135 [Punica granatum]|nr:hypothetical protein CRG98_017135 [Punica granatum]